MIELKVKIDEVDYGGVLEKALPEILPRMAKKHGGVMQKVLLELSGKSGEMAKSAVKYLPKSLQDEIAVNLLNTYRDKLIGTLHQFASEQGIALSVSDISVELKD